MSAERGAYKLAPEVVFIDARVARTMPEENPDGALLGFGNVVQAFAERRNANLHAVEAIEQVFLKPACGHFADQVASCRGNNSHTHANRCGTADRHDLLILDRP